MQDFKFTFSTTEEEIKHEHHHMLVEAVKQYPERYASTGLIGSDSLSLNDVMKETWFVERLVNRFLYRMSFIENSHESITVEIKVGKKVFKYAEIKI